MRSRVPGVKRFYVCSNGFYIYARVPARRCVSFTVVREMNGLSDGRLQNYAEGEPVSARDDLLRIIKAPCV